MPIITSRKVFKRKAGVVNFVSIAARLVTKDVDIAMMAII